MLNGLFWFLVVMAVPMLVIAFAPYWFVAVLMVAFAALHYFAATAAAADPDTAWEDKEWEGLADPLIMLWLAFGMTLVIRLITEFLR
jgi:hypothetical protein